MLRVLVIQQTKYLNACKRIQWEDVAESMGSDDILPSDIIWKGQGLFYMAWK